MRISANLSAGEFLNILSLEKTHLTYNITATVEELEEMLEEYRIASGDDSAGAGFSVLTDNKLVVRGAITEIQTDCYPMLVTVKTGDNTDITFAVNEPLRTKLKNSTAVGDVMTAYLILKPKYHNGDFYYDLRLTNYDIAD